MEAVDAEGLRERITWLESKIKVLEEGKGRYWSLSDPAFEGIIIVSNGKVLDVNEAALRHTGYTSEEIIGLSFIDLFHPDSRPQIGTAIGKPVMEAVEAILIKKDGQPRTMRVSARLMRIQEKPTRIVSFMDVTDLAESRHQIEEMVQRKEDERQRLYTILNTLPVGVVLINQQGQVEDSNVRAKEIWGLVTDIHPKSMKEYRTLKGWWADTGIPLKAEDWTVVRAMRGNKAIIGDMIDIQRLDGSRGCILNSAAPLRLGGRITGGVIVTEDITQQRKLEHAAIEAKERAELYIDLLSHDINNSIAAARGLFELIDEKTGLDGRAQKRLAKGLACLDDVFGLIEKVKKIQIIDGSDGRRELIDLGWLVEDVVRSFKFAPEKKVTINFEPSFKRMVMASGLIADVFINLIDNSIKHSPGPVTIDINMGKTLYEGREFYLVSVEDDGPGITDDMKRQVFNRLQRGKTKATGSGLGLYLVRRLIEDYQGRVWVEDRVPKDHTKGARFVVLLPAASSGSD